MRNRPTNRLTNVLLAVIAMLLAALYVAPPVEQVASAQMPSREADRLRTGAAFPYPSGWVTGEVFRKTGGTDAGFYGDDGAGGYARFVQEVEPAWIALTPASGWANVGGSFPTLAYRKRHGRLELRGAITGAGTTLFTLPSGYYINDGQFRRFTVTGQQGGANTPTLLMRTNADVTFIGGATDFISFDGISLPLS
jgi:hypothetical protein